LYNIDKATGTIGNQKVLDKRRSKAFGFAKSVRLSAFETNQNRNVGKEMILQPHNDKVEWRAKFAKLGKAPRELNLAKAPNFINEPEPD